jgi:hypothetical protein
MGSVNAWLAQIQRGANLFIRHATARIKIIKNLSKDLLEYMADACTTLQHAVLRNTSL